MNKSYPHHIYTQVSLIYSVCTPLYVCVLVLVDPNVGAFTVKSTTRDLSATHEKWACAEKAMEAKQTELLQLTERRNQLQTRLNSLKDEKIALQLRKADELQLSAAIDELNIRVGELCKSLNQVFLI